jgi:histidine triad (HIT) family protein
MIMSHCIFCDILNDRAEATFVYRDDLVSAFMDIQPINRGHVLVVPNAHATYLSELPEHVGSQMFRVAQKMAAAIRTSGLKCEGIDIFLADGEAAMQEILHVHMHVFPRFEGDGFDLQFPDRYFVLPSRSELEVAAEEIRGAL